MEGPHSEFTFADHLRVFYLLYLGFPKNKECREGEIIQQNFRSNSLLSPNNADTTSCFFQFVICYSGGRLGLPRINLCFISRNLTYFCIVNGCPLFHIKQFIFFLKLMWVCGRQQVSYDNHPASQTPWPTAVNA